MSTAAAGDVRKNVMYSAVYKVRLGLECNLCRVCNPWALASPEPRKGLLKGWHGILCAIGGCFSMSVSPCWMSFRVSRLGVST